jgi:hypothetical protein
LKEKAEAVRKLEMEGRWNRLGEKNELNLESGVHEDRGGRENGSTETRRPAGLQPEGKVVLGERVDHW